MPTSTITTSLADTYRKPGMKNIKLVGHLDLYPFRFVRPVVVELCQRIGAASIAQPSPRTIPPPKHTQRQSSCSRRVAKVKFHPRWKAPKAVVGIATMIVVRRSCRIVSRSSGSRGNGRSRSPRSRLSGNSLEVYVNGSSECPTTAYSQPPRLRSRLEPC
jgi:hypothetical protein